MVDGYAKPAIYGDGSGGAYTLNGQITLAASSDVGNYYGNGMLTLAGKITGPGGLVLGKAAPRWPTSTARSPSAAPPATITAATPPSIAARSTCRRPAGRSPSPAT